MAAMSFTRSIALLAACGAVALPASSAAAKGPGSGGGGSDSRVIRTGSCSDGSTWKLKVKPDDGRLEVEFEVDQNRSGVRWNVSLRRGRSVVSSGSAVTRGPSGSFSFERRIAGGRGTTVRAVASRAGETCRGSATAR